MYIRFNRFQVYAKVFLLCLIGFMLVLFIKYPPRDLYKNMFGDILFVYMAILLIYQSVFIFLELLFLPKGVYINYTGKTITIYFFGTKDIVLAPGDIAGFRQIWFHTKGKEYDGIMIQTTQDKNILICDFNLLDYTPVKNFLQIENIPFDENIQRVKIHRYFIDFFKRPAE